MTLPNITNQTLNFDQNMMYNPSCITEMEKYDKFCTDFKANVISTMSSKVKLALIFFITLIILQFLINHVLKLNDETKLFLNKRIEWALIVTALCTIALMFI